MLNGKGGLFLLIKLFVQQQGQPGSSEEMFSLCRLIAAEMGRIHSIQPERGQSVEPLLWTKMSQFLTLVQGSISPAQLRHTARYDL